MRAKPFKFQTDLKNLLPKRLGGMQDPTPDTGTNPPFDTHERPDKLLADPRSRTTPAGADDENRALAAAIRAVFAASRKPVDNGTPRFVLTWRMYPNSASTVAGTSGSCGCGCSCT
jgi:hypothetical protein